MTPAHVPRNHLFGALVAFIFATIVLALVLSFAPVGKAEANGANTSMLEQEIADLRSRVSVLEARVNALVSQENDENRLVAHGTDPRPAPTPDTPAPVPPPPNSGPGRIDQNGGTFNGGWTTYLTGHGFGDDEQVLVTMNGALVTTAETDPSGSFSAGVPLPDAPGAYTYTFTGQTSGVVANATIYAARPTIRVVLP